MILFAMMVIGGIGRAEGAVVGAAIVTIIDKGLIELGPLRIIIIAAIMLIVTIIGREGITGARKQFRAFRYRKSGERRALRTEKNGEVMPEEATEIFDKQEIYFRRFNKRLRENLKKMITPELIEEHRINPTGNHSDKLSRVLNYFRRAETTDKYGIKRVIKNKSFIYKIIAFSGRKTHPPRNVDDKEYDKLSEALHAVFILRVNDLLES
jgi:branched-chain amino acid transport system permease protein